MNKIIDKLKNAKMDDLIWDGEHGVDAKPTLLGFFPADKKWVRILRRGVIILLLGGASFVIVDLLEYNIYSESWVMILTAILAMIDKTLSEYRK